MHYVVRLMDNLRADSSEDTSPHTRRATKKSKGLGGGLEFGQQAIRKRIFEFLHCAERFMFFDEGGTGIDGVCYDCFYNALDF